MRTIAALTALVALQAFASSALVHAQQRAPAAEVEVLHIRGPIYLIAGAGANVTASIGPDGVLVADTGTAQMSDKVLAAIEAVQRQLVAHTEPPLGWGALTRSTLERERATPAPSKPIRFVIDTNGDEDHTGGNAKVLAAGKTITGGNVAGDLGDAKDAAALYAHENVMLRMSKAATAAGKSATALPTDTYFTPFYKLSHFFNGEGVQIIHLPKAHTDGDSMVWFRGLDVIATGDVFSTMTYPVIDMERGGSIHGVLNALNLAFSPVDIIKLMGPNTAAFIGKTDRGTVEAGKLADLVILDGDPLEGYWNLLNAKVVIKGGAIVADKR